MEVRVRHGKGLQSLAFARFHRVICDQSFDEGGDESGMTPPELMLSALGCCAMHYATEYLKARHLSLDGIEIRVSATKGGQPVQLAEIGIEADVPGLTARARDGLIKAMEACLLHRTLTHPPTIKVSMATMVTEGAVAVQPANLTS